VVHIFSERARQYYDLERLWRNAERIEFHEPSGPAGTRPKTHDERHNESEGNVTQQ
jgi:Ribosomal silencing factor during starvation